MVVSVSILPYSGTTRTRHTSHTIPTIPYPNLEILPTCVAIATDPSLQLHEFRSSNPSVPLLFSSLRSIFTTFQRLEGPSTPSTSLEQLRLQLSLRCVRLADDHHLHLLPSARSPRATGPSQLLYPDIRSSALRPCHSKLRNTCSTKDSSGQSVVVWTVSGHQGFVGYWDRLEKFRSTSPA